MSEQIAANIAGLVVMCAGRFGVTIAPHRHADIVAALGALGCLINLGISLWAGQ